jgi:hypothetical protein
VKKGEQSALSLPPPLIPVFTDVRFPNEADMIRGHGGIIVRVTATEVEREARMGYPPPRHASEYAMDNYDEDYVLDSSGLRNGDYMAAIMEIHEQTTGYIG